AGADFLDDSRALVPADDGHRGGQVAGDDVLVGMAQATAAEGDEHLSLLRRVEFDLLDRPLLVPVPQHRCASLHATSLARAAGESRPPHSEAHRSSAILVCQCPAGRLEPVTVSRRAMMTSSMRVPLGTAARSICLIRPRLCMVAAMNGLLPGRRSRC